MDELTRFRSAHSGAIEDAGYMGSVEHSKGSYAAGFAQGEHDAFHDRRAGRARELNETPSTAEEIGYWAAYSPRSATWGALHRTPVKPSAYEEAE